MLACLPGGTRRCGGISGGVPSFLCLGCLLGWFSRFMNHRGSALDRVLTLDRLALPFLFLFIILPMRARACRPLSGTCSLLQVAEGNRNKFVVAVLAGLGVWDVCSCLGTPCRSLHHFIPPSLRSSPLSSRCFLSHDSFLRVVLAPLCVQWRGCFLRAFRVLDVPPPVE